MSEKLGVPMIALLWVLGAWVIAWSWGCAGFAATPEAGFGRMVGWEHRMCVENNSCYFVEGCHAAAAARCVDAGYPPSCGDGDIEGSCGDAIQRRGR